MDPRTARVLLDVPGEPKREDASFTYRTYVDLFEARDEAEASRNLRKAPGFTGLT